MGVIWPWWVKQQSRGRAEKPAVTSRPSGQDNLGLEAGGQGNLAAGEPHAHTLCPLYL